MPPTPGKPSFLALTVLGLLLGSNVSLSQTQDTDDHREWTQYLFNKANMTATTFANTTFTVTTPHAWSHVNGSSLVEIFGEFQLRGSGLGATSWYPYWEFDNHAMKDACTLRFNFPTGDVQDRYYPVHLRCAVDRWVTDGSHGIHMGDASGATSPTITNIQLTFYLVQDETITFQQPDARPAVDRVEKNLETVNDHLNETRENATRLRSGFLQYWNQFNATDFGGANSSTNVTTGDTLLKDSSGNGLDLSIFRYGMRGVIGPSHSGPSNSSEGKFSKGLHTGYSASCGCNESFTSTFLKGAWNFYDTFSPYYVGGPFTSRPSHELQNVSFFAAVRQNQNSLSNYTRLVWENGKTNFELQCYFDGSMYHVFYQHTAYYGVNSSSDVPVSGTCNNQVFTIGFIRHIQGILVNSSVDIYFNGAKIDTIHDAATVADFENIETWDLPLLGQDPTTIGDFDIYEMRLWNKAIPESTMLKLMDPFDNTYTNKSTGDEIGLWFFEPSLPITAPPSGIGLFSSFEKAVGLSAVELGVLLSLLVLGLMVNARGRDLGAKVVGAFILLIVGLVSLALRDVWIGHVEFSIAVLLIAGYAFFRAAVEELRERRAKPKRTDPDAF